MPTYEYRCKACEHQFEEFQSMSARPLRKCPECGRPRLERLIGPGAGVIFKGSGFYETDYRSESYKKAAEKDKPDSGSDKKKSDEKGSGGDATDASKKKAESKGAAVA